MMGICSEQWVVEADGSVYPCDFYVLDEWKLGNIRTASFEEMNEKREELDFVSLSRHVPDKCRDCRWYPLCRNGCRRDRELLPDGRTPGLTATAQATRISFLMHIRECWKWPGASDRHFRCQERAFFPGCSRFCPESGVCLHPRMPLLQRILLRMPSFVLVAFAVSDTFADASGTQLSCCPAVGQE